MKLDKKDRKILYQLDIDARQSNSQIAKIVGLSKDAVGYRIRNLEKSKVIRGYTTIIDSKKLGYIFYRANFNLIDLSPEKMDEMISFLREEKNVWWIARLDGSWNFIFAIWTKSDEEFREFYNDRFCAKYRQYIKTSLICPITNYTQYSRNYLLDNKELKISPKFNKQYADYDDIDLEILRMLSKDARTRLLDIATKLKINSMTVYRRIKNLEKKGIILQYKADLNVNLLRGDFYSIKINLSNMSQLRQIENYIKTIPEMTAKTEAIGSYDIEFDLEVEDSKQYFSIMEGLQAKFDSIREIIYFRVLENYKILYLPEI